MLEKLLKYTMFVAGFFILLLTPPLLLTFLWLTF